MDLDRDGNAMSAQTSSDSGLQAILHPLPILEISDHITRTSERGYEGAIVGALLGQPSGREVTVEHSFPCKTLKGEDGFHAIDQAWFKTRLNQMKLVHQNPPLDLVGWYALVPKTGPTNNHAALHKALSAESDSLVLLGLHLDQLLKPAEGAGAVLPITIYEAELEADGDRNTKEVAGEDLEMSDAHHMSLKFRELPYVTETGEAEMIAMQFVREGGANASLEGAEKKVAVDADAKGKRRAVSKLEEAPNKDSSLNKEESEYMSVLQAKANAIKMMKSRIELIIAYLQKLPPDFVTGKLTSAQAAEVATASRGQFLHPSNKILRQIQALVTNLELATPTDTDSLKAEMMQETNDVQLLSMISALVSSVDEVRELGKTFSVVEAARNQKSRYNALDSVFSSQTYSVAGDIIH